MKQPLSYHPDFQAECRLCGTSPCVVVAGHAQPETELCGPHFFSDLKMLDWEEWNEDQSDDN